MIIWLASFPRSGNSFFREVSRNYFGREVYSIYQEKKASVDSTELQRMALDTEAYVVKTHEMPVDSNHSMYLVRDGRDALVSLTWYNLTSHLEPGRKVSDDEYAEALKAEILSDRYGGWSGNILAWTARQEKTVIVKFEELIANPEQVVADAFEMVGLPRHLRNGVPKVPSFDELHSRNPHLYRKGKVGGWQTQFPDDLHDLFWEKHGNAMETLGYAR